MPKMKYPNIEAERARKGMTLSELAELLNVTRKTYYNWLVNGAIPMSKLSIMADFFGVSVDYLLDHKTCD